MTFVVDGTHRALRNAIENAIRLHPRSLQEEIGASEIGTPCSRKLGFKLGNVEPLRPEPVKWRPTVGTAVHSWLERALILDNLARTLRGEPERWLTETTVHVGVYGLAGERELGGHGDVFDLIEKRVVDWKVPGVTRIREARTLRSPGDLYEVQAHGYGLGYENLGFEVREVAVYFLPAAGELGDGYYWSAPYDRSRIDTALARATGILAGIEAMGPALIPLLPKAADYCEHCPWWSASEDVPDERGACSGVGPFRDRNTRNDGPAFGPART